ncbi:MAG: aminoglycoside phosphotransferase family protein [Actinobacteria bacterium]|nr:aminoglycoside phosphotransferase family protein [Actinomycetota bacterium]
MNTQNAMLLLDKDTVVPYLVRRGILKRGGEVETFSGGVSSVVLGVRNQEVDVVVKQALPQLRTEIEWKADRRRSMTEARAIEILKIVTPGNVPNLIDVDREIFALTMERVPRDYLVWKEELLLGNILPKTGADLGLVLASWHNFAPDKEEVMGEFQEGELFEQLRVSPFYRTVQHKNLSLSAKIADMIDQITQEKLTLVHGDFSPKNILVAMNKAPVVLDFEVMNAGNPVFDLAFMLAHLVCKQIRTDSGDEKALLRETAIEFLSAYALKSNLGVASNLSDHVALIALSRVEGVSPVNYLTDSKQEELRMKAKQALVSASSDVLDLFR